jgi:predicted metal-binding protein
MKCSLRPPERDDLKKIDFILDVVHHKLIRNLSKSSKVEIPSNVEILGSNCFLKCNSLSSITFESNSHLTWIESAVFSYSSLQLILIPNNFEIRGSSCCSRCASPSSITFESNSHLRRIESEAFSFSSFTGCQISFAGKILWECLPSQFPFFLLYSE